MENRVSHPGVPVRRAGLRVRAAAAMALGGLMVSLALGLLAYELSRSYLLDRRQELMQREAFLNARLANDLVTEETTELPTALETIGGVGRRLLIRDQGRWFGSVVGVGQQQVPEQLVDQVAAGEPAVAFTTIDDEPVGVVGVPLPDGERSFFQVFTLVDLAATLDSIRNALIVAALVTTVGSAGYGLFMSGRVLRPLRDTAAAARRIAEGDMSARLDDVGDPDLTTLVETFNAMAAALEERIERERRFAADVSHELRTPLTALTSAVRIIDRRAGELSPAGREAVAVLHSQLEHFSRLVLEILDLSRLESGTADVQSELVDLHTVMLALAADSELPPDRLVLRDGLPDSVRLDPRRLRVVVRNLIENADRYGGGCTRLTVAPFGARWSLLVDDAGPGVPEEERESIFERFHRGSVGSAPGAAKGTGLGLSLVAESVRAMGGVVSVTESPDGGARFVVELPVQGGSFETSRGALAAPSGAEPAAATGGRP